MNRTQKVALSLVISISASLMLSIIAIIIIYLRAGFPKALYGFCFMGLSGLGSLSLFFTKKDEGVVTCDERDKQINRAAALAGFACSYLVMGIACMIPFSVLGPQAKISVRLLPQIFGIGAITMFFIHSVMILIGYGRANKGVENE